MTNSTNRLRNLLAASFLITLILSIFIINSLEKILITNYNDSIYKNSQNLSKIWQNYISTQNFKFVSTQAEKLLGAGVLEGFQIRSNYLRNQINIGDTSIYEMNNKIEVQVFFDNEAKEELIATLIFFYPTEHVIQNIKDTKNKYSLLVFIFISLILFIYIISFKTITRFIRDLKTNIISILYKGQEVSNKDTGLLSVYSTLNEIKNELNQYKQAYQEKEKARIQLLITKQVAHDIRSPLTALELVMEDIKSLPEDSRILTVNAIERIKDIANNLSKEDFSQKEMPCIVSIALDSIVNEKKVEYQQLKEINFTFIDGTSKLNFIELIESDFLRLISNIINNSVDALKENGNIEISLKKENKSLVIVISDNGPGFPEKILNTPIKVGNTVGKETGQGLGLHFAYEKVVGVGGQITLKNNELTGANVTISLPIINSPKWFSPELKLPNESKIYIIDDDTSIHNVWRKLLKDNHTSQIVDLYNESEIITNLNNISKDSYVLIDYDLRHDYNGIYYINKFNLKNVVLVTSNYDTESVINFCIKNDIKIIPKHIVSSIKISFEKL